MYRLLVNLNLCIKCGNCTDIFNGKYLTLMSHGELLLGDISGEEKKVIDHAVNECHVEALLFEEIGGRE